jgi:hypothetical protein
VPSGGREKNTGVTTILQDHLSQPGGRHSASRFPTRRHYRRLMRLWEDAAHRISQRKGAKKEKSIMTILKGRVALVTGSARGTDKAIAERCASLGADIVVNYSKDKVAAEETIKNTQRFRVKAAVSV